MPGRFIKHVLRLSPNSGRTGNRPGATRSLPEYVEPPDGHLLNVVNAPDPVRLQEAGWSRLASLVVGKTTMKQMIR